MDKICVMCLGKDGLFSFKKQMNVSRIPTIGEKIIIGDSTEDQVKTYVYNVVDVHFDNNAKTDVFVIKGALVYAYLSNLVNTITLK